MKFLWKSICVCLLVVLAVSAHAAALTEESVRQMLTRMEDAANKQDVKAFAQELSDTFSITIYENAQSKTLAKQEYLARLEAFWPTVANYTVKLLDVEITLDGDSATVNATIKESMTIQGKNIFVETKGASTVKLIDGKPLTTEITGHLTMQSEPSSSAEVKPEQEHVK